MITLNNKQEIILKEYMSTVLDSIENKNPDESIGILLNEIAAWKVYEITNILEMKSDD